MCGGGGLGVFKRSHGRRIAPGTWATLTTDCPEFRIGPGQTGANATVENIARVFYDLLAAAIRNATPDAELRSITVWETDRTSATYPA